MKKVPYIINSVQAEKLIAQISFPKYRFMIKLMYELAIRVGELVSIRKSDIRYEQDHILIRGKGSKQRLLPLTKMQIYQLRVYTSMYPSVEYLFENSWSKAYSTRGVRNIVYDTCQAAFGHYLIHPHTLRHCKATDMVNKEVQITKVQRILGHESLQTTQLYLHYSVDDLREALQR